MENENSDYFRSLILFIKIVTLFFAPPPLLPPYSIIFFASVSFSSSSDTCLFSSEMGHSTAKVTDPKSNTAKPSVAKERVKLRTKHRRDAYDRFVWDIQKLLQETLTFPTNASYSIQSDASFVSYRLKTENGDVIIDGYIEVDRKKDSILWVQDVQSLEEEHTYTMRRTNSCLKDIERYLSKVHDDNKQD